MGVRGLLNVQFAVSAGVLYVIEANPRASRTVPFVSKALGIPLAKAASRVMAGSTIAELKAEGLLPEQDGSRVPLDAPVAVKEAVLPFKRFRTADGHTVDSVLGPEMRSTGEVMGIDKHFDTAFAKSQSAAGGPLPTSGRVFVSVANRDKRTLVGQAKRLVDLGFQVVSTGGTAEVLRRNGIPAEVVAKIADAGHEDGAGTVLEQLHAGTVDLVLNTPSGGDARTDGYEIRAAATSLGVPVITTTAEFGACLQAIEAMRSYEWSVTSLQEHDARLQQAVAGPEAAA